MEESQNNHDTDLSYHKMVDKTINQKEVKKWI